MRFEGVRLRYVRCSHTGVGGVAPAAGGTAGGPAPSPAEGAAGSAGSVAGAAAGDPAAAPVEGSAGSAAEGAAWDPAANSAEGAWALAGLDLELHPGERLGLVGRTGASFGTCISNSISSDHHLAVRFTLKSAWAWSATVMRLGPCCCIRAD